MSFQHPAQTQTGHPVSRPYPSSCRRQLITFDMIPDDVLLKITDFFLGEDVHIDLGQLGTRARGWIKLAHVCRRWRSVVFLSPLRLNLQLLCTPETPARTTLGVWPPLPLIIRNYDDIAGNKIASFDNVIAALEHNDRVYHIDLGDLSGSELENVANSAAMLKPFPDLTFLQLSIRLSRYDGRDRMLPDSFLGGTAPRLRSLSLEYIPFLGLPKLLLSATHLAYLYLYSVPRSGYIPPETLATSLSTLTSLKSLILDFRHPRPRPSSGTRRLPAPLTRFILPSLTQFRFKGTSEYLEVILSRIDTPRLDRLDITFFNQTIFNIPQLFQFISRRPTLGEPERGYIVLGSKAIIVRFPSQTTVYEVLSVKIACKALDWQLSSLEQICISSLPPVSTMKDLHIFEDQRDPPRWQDDDETDDETALWPGILRSFVAVKNLYVSEEYAPRIALVLQEFVGGRTMEVLPALENIFSEGYLKGIEKFVAARQLTSHPVAVSRVPRREIEPLPILSR